MKTKTYIRYFFGALVLLWATAIFPSDGESQTRPQEQTDSQGIQPGTSTATPRSPSSPKSGEQIKWQVIAAGGTYGTSTNFILSGTAGQTAIGKGSSTNFGVNQGFWQGFVATCDDCGDANSDGIIDISDAVFLIAYIFSGGAAPGVCVIPNGMGDANGDGIVDISDAVYLISYIFSGGPVPHC